MEHFEKLNIALQSKRLSLILRYCTKVFKGKGSALHFSINDTDYQCTTVSRENVYIAVLLSRKSFTLISVLRDRQTLTTKCYRNVPYDKLLANVTALSVFSNVGIGWEEKRWNFQQLSRPTYSWSYIFRQSWAFSDGHVGGGDDRRKGDRSSLISCSGWANCNGAHLRRAGENLFWLGRQYKKEWKRMVLTKRYSLWSSWTS